MLGVGRGDDDVRLVQSCCLRGKDHVAVERRVGGRRSSTLARLGPELGGPAHRGGCNGQEFDLGDEGVQTPDARASTRPDELPPEHWGVSYPLFFGRRSIEWTLVFVDVTRTPNPSSWFTMPNRFQPRCLPGE